ncbi:hypothetical protein J1614_011798 [Plenodomus biglobosus]|nr:hypothetical protein J1614_011798 [Plenodomus biglobosus]
MKDNERGGVEGFSGGDWKVCQYTAALVCGKKTVEIQEDDAGVGITFEDEKQAKGDVLIGCEGIYSVTRLKHNEPEQTAMYSATCNAFESCPPPPPDV